MGTGIFSIRQVQQESVQERERSGESLQQGCRGLRVHPSTQLVPSTAPFLLFCITTRPALLNPLCILGHASLLTRPVLHSESGVNMQICFPCLVSPRLAEGRWEMVCGRGAGDSFLVTWANFLGRCILMCVFGKDAD